MKLLWYNRDPYPECGDLIEYYIFLGLNKHDALNDLANNGGDWNFTYLLLDDII